jgi:hypothetical protein
MAKTKRTPEQKVEALQGYLKAEIKSRKDILDDQFLQSNLEGIELSLYALQLSVLEKVLKELEAL